LRASVCSKSSSSQVSAPQLLSNNRLHSKKQRVCDFTENYLRQVEPPKPDVETKINDFDADSKTCAENFSGKKQSSTASRSDTSDADKKEFKANEEAMESSILKPEKRITNRHDIRSYFQKVAAEKTKTREMLFNKIFKIKRDEKFI
jgi:hypothetical protein